MFAPNATGDNADPTNDVDQISALEYNISGDCLATGDKSGRITVLKLENDNKQPKNQENWVPFFQYQSHDPEFDFLKSLEIEAKINQIKFCHPVGNNSFLLSTNDKTIKLWKIGSRTKYVPQAVSNFHQTGNLKLPEIDRDVTVADPASLLQASPKRVFSNAHTYHINSLALNSDMETFVSADDLRINWWYLNNSNTSFNIVDIKPDNLEELTEVISSVQFHPQHCNMLIYSSSRGVIKLCDTRSSALCNSYPKVFAEPINTTVANKSFITDILNSISDVTYSSDGRYIISRDYLSVKIWDVNMEARPVKTISLHEYLRPMLYDLYTSDLIFDKFEVCCSPDGQNIATGSYSNQLKIFHPDHRGLKTIDLPRMAAGDAGATAGAKSVTSDLAKSLEKVKIGKSGNGSSSSVNTPPEEIRFDEKVLHCAWHPKNNTVAVAGKAGLCLYKV